MSFLGIFAALGALFGWGIGDFLIQKTARKTDTWKSIFYISVIGSVGLFPFIAKDLSSIHSEFTTLLFLIVAAIVTFFTFTLDTKALEDGKITVIEPIVGLEGPITVLLSVFIIKEHLNLVQFLLIIFIFCGSILAVTIHHTQLHYHKRILEKGVILAFMSALGMGLTNFLVGTSSQKTSPLLALWFIHIVALIIGLIKFSLKKELKSVVTTFFKHSQLILITSIIDIFAWIFYAYSTTLIPISIAVTISESFIIITTILGFLISHEKVQWHQVLGIGISVIGIILLSAITSN